MERYAGLKEIKLHDDYIESKTRLNNYLKQYKWILETEKPYEEIRDALSKFIEKRKKYEGKVFGETTSSDEEKKASENLENNEENIISDKEILENENGILSLKNQYDAIKNDTYIAGLKRNITALFVTIEDYEASIDNTSMKGKSLGERFKYYREKAKKKFRFIYANLTGIVPGEMNLEVENNDDIAKYIIENYDLINISKEYEETDEKNLVIVPEIGSSQRMYNRLIADPVNSFIRSRGIEEKAVMDETKGSTNKNTVSDNNPQERQAKKQMQHQYKDKNEKNVEEDIEKN